jgi:prepilin-type processing-associated H-X9-DG protein
MLYVHDYDETYPRLRFHAPGASAWTAAAKGKNTYVWTNAIRPYLKNLDVLGCPANPMSRSTPGTPGSMPPKPGMNAEGWESEPEQRMPISYAMNACASTWYPADTAQAKASPPIRLAQLQRPAETFIIGETQWIFPDMHADWLWNTCGGLFVHGTRNANFVFYDGHASTKKWMSTLYPLTTNNWQIDEPSQDPKNRRISTIPGCEYLVPATPEARDFQKPACQPYQ